MLLLFCEDSMALKLPQEKGLVDIMIAKKNMVWHLNRSVVAGIVSDTICTTAAALMQMIVGVLLFTPLLFLLPTTAVYYALALLLHTAVLVVCWGLEVLIQLAQSIPLYTIWCSAVNPGMLPGDPVILLGAAKESACD